MISFSHSDPGQDPRDGDAATAQIDMLLGAALRGECARWPYGSAPEHEAEMLERILFHGIAGLLAVRRDELDGWPPSLLDAVRQRAVGGAMWELQHKAAISVAIEALAGARIPAIILKGTALAYDLYDQPSLRPRGDTDILIDVADLGRARTVLSDLGYRREYPKEETVDSLQELWVIEGRDGTNQSLDLHWQMVDAPALERLLPFETCLANTQSLVNFSKSALRLSHPLMLLHAIAHRAKHKVAPYFVGDKVYRDGDRLIWIADFDLIARALDESGWSDFCELGLSYQIAPACLEALETAQRLLGVPVPEEIAVRLRAATQSSRENDYLLRDRLLSRVWQNFLALKGPRRKFSYLRRRLLPSPGFMREKYGHLPKVPVAFLYVWRIAELFVRRQTRRKM